MDIKTLAGPTVQSNTISGANNTLTMDVTDLKLQSPPASFDSSSFVSAVDMNVTSDGTHKILQTYFGIPSLQSTGATDGIATVNIGAFETGTLTYSEALLSLKMPSTAHDPGLRPLAGSYTGSVTVTVTLAQSCQPPVAGIFTDPDRFVPLEFAMCKPSVTPLGEATRRVTV